MVRDSWGRIKILILSPFDACVLIISAILATACAAVRGKNGLKPTTGQWLNDLLGCGSTIILISIAAASVLAAINIISPMMRQAMTEEMKANGLMLAAAFFYSGGIIGLGIWRSVTDATPATQS